jgi:hypothetical protein
MLAATWQSGAGCGDRDPLSLCHRTRPLGIDPTVNIKPMRRQTTGPICAATSWRLSGRFDLGRTARPPAKVLLPAAPPVS